MTLDLTGLPPTPAEVDAFLADTSPDAYEKVVDRLLQSPRYGEHMARYWLDAARYGDTHGLHLDNYREMWPYRDWVIKAFNDNMPFDRFIVEQLAGDLLPERRRSTSTIATGFNRCHVTTSEGGSIDEEVYVRNVVDRVETNGTVFLGLTVGCARCHDHKYDPVTQKEYYQLFAFFNSIDGSPLDGNAARHAADRQGADAGAGRRARRSSTSKIAGARKQIAPRVGQGRRTTTPADAERAGVAERGRLRLDRRRPARRARSRRPTAASTGLELRRQARAPGLQRRASRCSCTADGLSQHRLHRGRRRA